MNLIARRPWMVAAAVAVSFFLALGFAGWALTMRDDAEGRPLGPRIAIDLVAPVEPAIVEGGILEIGALNDGFDEVDLERGAVVQDPTWDPVAAGEDPEPEPLDIPRMPPPTPIATDDFSRPGDSPGLDPDPLADGSRWFGLDRLLADAPPPVKPDAIVRRGALPLTDRCRTMFDRRPNKSQ